MMSGVGDPGEIVSDQKEEDREMADDVMEMLGEDVVLCDGGMILEARWRGYDTPAAIVEHPDAIRQIHRDFLNAGSQVLEAVTWFTSRSQLDRHFGWGGRLDEVNRMGVQLAKEASSGTAPVGGCLVSTRTGSWEGDPIFDPQDPSSRDRAKAEWDEQIAILVDAGADFLIPETFHRLDEVLVCLECCKKTSVPTMVFLGMSRTTEDGATAAECARVLAGEGADVVGLVCNGAPEGMLNLVTEMRQAVDVPVAWQPNGFGPGGKDTRVPLDVMAGCAAKAKAEGINLIGACCGAGPNVIRAMARALGRGPEAA